MATSGTQLLPLLVDLSACTVTLALVMATWSGTEMLRPLSLNAISHAAIPAALLAQVLALAPPLADRVAVPAVLWRTEAVLLVPPLMVNTPPPGCKVTWVAPL